MLAKCRVVLGKPTSFTNLGDLIINHIVVSLTEAISIQISKFIGDLLEKLNNRK
jgi:hypothetical protein